MAVEPQPTYIPEWNTGGSNRTNPSGAEKIAGWALNDQPPSSYFNWLQYYTGAWFTWLSQRVLKGGAEIDLVVNALSPDTSGGGGGLTLVAGNGFTAGAGGDASLSGGDAAGSNAGGNAVINGGDGDSGGGDVNLTGGDATSSGSGGEVNLTGGDAAGSGIGGNVDAQGGDGVGNIGGSIRLTAGASTTGAFDGGVARLRAGEAQDTGDGGDAQVWAGHATGTAGAGGNADINGGNSAAGNGGDVDIDAGQATGASGDGGDVNIDSGLSANGQPGNVNIKGAAGTAAKGGDVNVTGGTTTAGEGGNAAIAGGVGVGGEGGDVTVDGGASDTDGGDVTVSGGVNSASGPGGYVTVKGGTATSGGGGSANVQGGDIGTNGQGGPASLRGGNSKGTDQQSGGVIISSGDSTGNRGGSVKLRVSEAGASGATTRPETDYLECDGDNKLVDIVKHTQFAAASDTVRGPIRVVGKSAEPTGPSAGDMYYDTRTNQVAVYNGTRYVNLNPLVFSMSDFAYTAEPPSFTSGADMVMNQKPYLGSVGTTPARHIIPANTLRVGSIIRIRMQFVMFDSGGGSTYPSPRVWVGSIGAGPSPYVSPSGIKTTNLDLSALVWTSYKHDCDINIRQITSPFKVDIHTNAILSDASGASAEQFTFVETYTLDTTVAVDVFPAVKWGTSSGWTIACQQFLVDII